MSKFFNIKFFTKALIIASELLAVGIIIYVIILPFYPGLKYSFNKWQTKTDDAAFKNLKSVALETGKIINNLPKNQDANRLVITKIGVNAPIIYSTNSDYALARGAWLPADSAAPGENGNVIITGHRFKYLPPSNLTFYLLDKLTPGDIVSVVWQKKEYYYKVKELKIVPATDISILAKSDKPILTMYTCDPIFSEKNRLVVVAELVE